jgi:beta-galactosidase
MVHFKSLLLTIFLFFTAFASAQRTITSFNNHWKFKLGDDSAARDSNYDDNKWRVLNLPHDWSIEGNFSKDHPTTFNQGALPAGVGWYRKKFVVSTSLKEKKVFIDFDGVYRNSEVWINGHYLGKRPNGYISFRYDLTSYLNFGDTVNVIAVKVDNSAQPSSRWYTGSGIYRNVWLVITNPIAINDRTVFITTKKMSSKEAVVSVKSEFIAELPKYNNIKLGFQIFDANGKIISSGLSGTMKPGVEPFYSLHVSNPRFWSPGNPYLYKVAVSVFDNKKLIDKYELRFGIRDFRFDESKGFFLNDKQMKILGVCMHHDLGALGAAINKRAMQRQLEILKQMGCNAIRTAHNPPAPEFLDLCDEMGFLVMDEAFDMWKKRKNRFDYNVEFNEWHKQDLEDMVIRDRNHPSIIMWSIGNEIREQFDSTGTSIAKELVQIVKKLDTTRPVTCALTENFPDKNFIYQSRALDVLGFNYKLDAYPDLPKRFPGEILIATETASALATRGHYDLPSDSNRKWPPDSKPFTNGNPDFTVSAYDHVFAYWGATHEASWKAVKKHDFISGVFVWSGFDFLGEPVPYQWPARSSYYGIIDLAGFPKDVYYLYQSEWTRKPVLHLFPHWTGWEKGKLVDVWAYYNNADEVELFLNGKSLGSRSKRGDSLHIMWRVPFEPGTLKAVSKKAGKIVLTKEIRSAGKAAKIQLEADRKVLKADGEDLAFITVKVLDADNNPVPNADHLIKFNLQGAGEIVGVDNGNPASMESFKAQERKLFNGLCLVIVRTTEKGGEITLTANAEGIRGEKVILRSYDNPNNKPQITNHK